MGGLIEIIKFFFGYYAGAIFAVPLALLVSIICIAYRNK